MRELKSTPAELKRPHVKPWFPLLLLSLCILTAAVCSLLYRYDNKYTAPGPGAVYGRMDLRGDALGTRGLVWLVDGWEFYGGALLTPEDFQNGAPTPDRYVFAGQLGGFETVNGAPHGSATYRLTISLPEEARTYALYLPEVFSACRLYVNGEERLALGQTGPGDYRAETAERIVYFEAAGQMELLLAAADYSHFYSGLVYPPALGLPDAVSGMAVLRLSLRVMLLTFTALIGGIALLLFASNPKDSLPALYALVCLFFLGYTCYPVSKTLFPALGGLHLMEPLSFCAMILLVFLLQRKLLALDHPANTFGIVFGGLVCVLCVVCRLLLPSAGLWLLLSYSRLMALYKWLSAALLTAGAVLGCRQADEAAPHARALLCGMAVFDAALVMDRVLPLYEPIYSGWFLELGSLCLVLLIGAVLLREIYSRAVTSLVLEESVRLTRQNIAMQKEQHRAMMEAIARERTFRHDLRQHISVLHAFAGADDLSALKRYFAELEGDLPLRPASVFCENAAVDAIIRHYAARASLAGVEFSAEVQVPEEISISEVDLCVIFGNLLENAVEACERQQEGAKRLHVRAGPSVGTLAITVENSFDGILQRSVYGFRSSKGARAGAGTASVRAAAKKYGGRAFFDAENGTFRASVILHL